MTVTSNPPEGFPTTIEIEHFFLECVSSTTAIWIVRILIVAIFLAVIGYWLYLENKNRPEDK